MPPPKSKIKEFGDFQTPEDVTHKILFLLKQQLHIKPNSIIEPNCGTGTFVISAAETYPQSVIYAIDINHDYIKTLKKKLTIKSISNIVKTEVANFFDLDWYHIIKALPPPVLVLGNPPWVTVAELTVLNGTHIPKKWNIYGFSGLEAKTGKSNFDVSELIIITLLDALHQQNIPGTIAMITKTTVSRKVLYFAHKNRIPLKYAGFFNLNAKQIFNAATSAGLFILQPNHASPPFSTQNNDIFCKIYSTLTLTSFIKEIGIIDGKLISNLSLYKKWQHLAKSTPKDKKNAKKTELQWRSGIKHDSSKVMVLTKKGNHFYNGFGKKVDIEDTYLYPLLKSSDIANGRISDTKKWLIVPQKKYRDDTAKIKEHAPKTWHYLQTYAETLKKRRSSVYKNQPAFAIFGVGPYTFAPYKVAISGLYKKLHFQLVTPLYGKPVVFDDTCYFLPCHSYQEAQHLFSLLNHPIAQEFYQSLIFWEAKRPITKHVLEQLDLSKLAKKANKYALDF